MALNLATVGQKITATFINLIIAQVNLQGSTRIIPSAATNGSVSATTGVVTSTAQALVRVRDAFPSTFQVFRVQFDVTLSAASGLSIRLASGATDSSSNYDSQRSTFINATTTSVQNLAGDKFELSAISVAGARHVGQFTISSANLADSTYVVSDSTVVVPSAMTASTGRAGVGGYHRTATAYDSFTVLAGSGNVTINRLTVEGIS